MSWDKELKDYRYYLSLEKKLSENTVQAYLHDLARISNYMEHTFGITEPEKVTADQIESFWPTSTIQVSRRLPKPVN